MTCAIFRSVRPCSPATAADRCLTQAVISSGIVTAKLDAMRIARFTGDVPQNVNFALKAEVARTFLDSKDIAYQTARSEQQLSPADAGRTALPFTIQIECQQAGSRSAAPSKRPSPTLKPSAAAGPSSVASPAPTTSTGEVPVWLVSEIAGRRMDRRKRQSTSSMEASTRRWVQGRPLAPGPGSAASTSTRLLRKTADKVSEGCRPTTGGRCSQATRPPTSPTCRSCWLSQDRPARSCSSADRCVAQLLRVGARTFVPQHIRIRTRRAVGIKMDKRKRSFAKERDYRRAGGLIEFALEACKASLRRISSRY